MKLIDLKYSQYRGLKNIEPTMGVTKVLIPETSYINNSEATIWGTKGFRLSNVWFNFIEKEGIPIGLMVPSVKLGDYNDCHRFCENIYSFSVWVGDLKNNPDHKFHLSRAIGKLSKQFDCGMALVPLLEEALKHTTDFIEIGVGINDYLGFLKTKTFFVQAPKLNWGKIVHHEEDWTRRFSTDIVEEKAIHPDVIGLIERRI